MEIRSGSNLRALLGWTEPYHAICREERNVSAILYHLLLTRGNLRRFLDLVEYSLPVEPEQTAIYFEYAYLRDLWNARLRDDPAAARATILSLLSLSNADALATMPTRDFNAFFGAVPRPSPSFIQSPSSWSLERFAANIAGSDELLRVCRFKWAFNTKPDLVIHTTREHALCLEAKLQSGEAQYPSKPSEKQELARRGLPQQRQIDLQAYLMRDLLGLSVELALLVEQPGAPAATHRTVTWRQAFDALDTSDCPAFLEAWIRRLRLRGGSARESGGG